MTQASSPVATPRYCDNKGIFTWIGGCSAESLGLNWAFNWFGYGWVAMFSWRFDKVAFFVFKEQRIDLKMTKISPGIDETMLKESIVAVSADVSFAYDHFPKYKLGPDNQILEEPRGVNNGSPLKEVVERETTQLSEQHKRLSVCDLASKFDKNLATSVKLADEAKLREVASLEGHVILKKLRDALESLRGCMAGRNKEDVEKAISMVDALAVKLTQKEGERIQEKFEVKKPANFLKQSVPLYLQASEDAKKLVNQEKSFSFAEIESARAVVQRFGEALDEQEKNPENSQKTQVKLSLLC
ncbi:stomatal closure-related actin-binding protein 3-like [Hibiscus syriacus]|uniref:stomatal closure-related actin-binding protein 3-like n=1 Tax=Hibiscus syriacus TaxID=106335 RepID=UPI00192082BC|nr:stomatal closure-related actin-binding protein 3-like [Hibiscus syriacus]